MFAAKESAEFVALLEAIFLSEFLQHVETFFSSFVRVCWKVYPSFLRALEEFY